MHGWWIAMGIVGLAVLALTPNYNRHRQRRAQVSQIRARVEAWLSAPDASTDGGGGVPPTFPSAPHRRTVPLSDPSSLGGTVYPGWRF